MGRWRRPRPRLAPATADGMHSGKVRFCRDCNATLRVYRSFPRCAVRGHRPWARTISAPASRASKIRRCSPGAVVSSMTSSYPARCTPASCAARTPTPGSAPSTRPRRAPCPASTRCSPPTTCRRAWRPAKFRCWCPIPAIRTPRTQLALARDEVCYVGQTIAVVIADNRYLAEDAAAAVRDRFRDPAGGERLPRCRASPARRCAHSDLATQHRRRRADELRRRRRCIRAARHMCSRRSCRCIAAAP